MKTVLGRIVRNATLNGNGTLGVLEDKYIASWYKQSSPDYRPFVHTVYYMSPVGMPRKYGFWAPPDLWARVLIGQPDNAPPDYWVYLGSVYEQREGYSEAKVYFLEKFEENFNTGVAPIQEAYGTSFESQAQGWVTKGRNGIVLSDQLAANSDFPKIGNNNIGVFLATGKSKFIRLQDSLPGNSIEIKNESGYDGITITGVEETNKPLGTRAIDISTAGNANFRSDAAELKIEVGDGSHGSDGHGTQLKIINNSYAFGSQSKTSMVAVPEDNIEILKAEGCGAIVIRSDHNDIEIHTINGRLMIFSKDDVQVRTQGSAKVYAASDVYVESGGAITLNATKDVNIQSKEGNINLRALGGGVNIETGSPAPGTDNSTDINLQSGGDGTVQLNKEDPGDVDLTGVPEVEHSKFNVELLRERVNSGEITL